MSITVYRDVETDYDIYFSKDDVVDFLEEYLSEFAPLQEFLNSLNSIISNDAKITINKYIYINDYEFDVDEDDVENLIEDAISDAQDKWELENNNMFDSIEVKSAYDECKLEILIKAYQKYTLTELEEKLEL